MPTVDDKEIIVQMLNNNGVYPGDPQVFAISRYTNMVDTETYHIALYRAAEIVEANSSPYVRNLRILWNKVDGLSPYGEKFLKENKVK